MENDRTKKGGDKITAETDVPILKDLYIQCYVLIESFNDDLSCDTLGTDGGGHKW